MSTDQPTLSEFDTPAVEDDEDDAPKWIPGGGEQSGASCRNCGGHVSRQYARQAGDNDNQVHACPQCSTKEERLNGAAAGRDGDPKANIGVGVVIDNPQMGRDTGGNW